MRVDVFGVVYQTKLAKQQIAKEFEMVQEYSSRLSLVKTREVNSKLQLRSFLISDQGGSVREEPE